MARNRDEIVKTRFGGDEEAYIAWMRLIGSKGGSKKGRKGFAAMSSEEMRAAAQKGGRISRRGPNAAK